MQWRHEWKHEIDQCDLLEELHRKMTSGLRPKIIMDYRREAALAGGGLGTVIFPPWAWYMCWCT